MADASFPITVLFATLKSCGISNREAATTLFNAQSELGGRNIGNLIDVKSQLSRRIVHAEPKNIPPDCFSDFRKTVPALSARILERFSVESCKGNLQEAAQALVTTKLADGHARMKDALDAHGVGAELYLEALAHIEHIQEANPLPLVTLHLMAIAVAGCTADGQRALSDVVSYAFDELDVDSQTAKTRVTVALNQDREGPPPGEFGIMRVRDNTIAAGTKFHRVGKEGLVIGALPHEEPAATDVDHDVSRRHARLWVADGRLFVTDLGSTNGTTVISPSSSMLSIVAMPDGLRDKVAAQAVELHYGDFICLGATTRYIVLPLVHDGGGA